MPQIGIYPAKKNPATASHKRDPWLACVYQAVRPCAARLLAQQAAGSMHVGRVCATDLTRVRMWACVGK